MLRYVMLHTSLVSSSCDRGKVRSHPWRPVRQDTALPFPTLGTVQYNAVQYYIIQYSTVQYNAVQYSTLQYNAVQYNTIQYNTIQYSTVQYIIVHHVRQNKIEMDRNMTEKTKIGEYLT